MDNRPDNFRNTSGQRRPQMPQGREARRPDPRGQGAPRPMPNGTPQRPGMSRPVPPKNGEGQAKPKLSAKKKSDIKYILAAILAVLMILIVILSIRSCMNGDEREAVGAPSDKVNLNNKTDKPDTTAPTSSVFASYTDSTKTLGADGIEFRSKCGILIDLDSNTVIASKDAEEKMYPASMTKIMTLIVAYEHIDDLNDTYTFKAEMLDSLYRENASVAGFVPDEVVPVKDLLYGAILPSGADATNALAEYVAGDEEHFAALMNEKVKALGLKNTHFVTASGLHDPNHYSTCHDMAVILRYAISDPVMCEILSAYKYTTTPTEKHPDGIELTSTLKSRMNGDEAEGVFVQGGKTGYTNEALNCLATFAANCEETEAQNVRAQYILVTGGASGEYAPVFDAIDIYGKYCGQE